MSNNVINTLIANLTSTEVSTGNVPINRGTGDPAFQSACAEFSYYQAYALGSHSILLPVSPATMVYLRNIDPAAAFQVNWTPNGGADAIVCFLNPGDQIIFFAKPGGSPQAPGITSLEVIPSAVGALLEYFIGG